MTHRNNINVRLISSGTTRSFEHGIWQIILKSITIHVVGIYRPPSLSTNHQFVSDISDFIEGILPKHTHLMFMGDFNLHINDESNTISEFKDILYSFGLEQHVNFGTHTSGNYLDLVITEVSSGVKVVSCAQGPFISDHCVVKLVLNVQKENAMSKTITRRNWSEIDQIAFAAELNDLSVSCDNNVDDFVDQFESKLLTILDKHAPLQERHTICRHPKPWFNEEIVSLKRSTRKAERTWLKYREPHQLEKYKDRTRKNCVTEFTSGKCKW